MKTILSSLTIVIAFNSQAAIPKSQPSVAKGLELAQEILSMPDENRKMIGQAKAEALYPDLIALSKAEGQSMETRWKALTLAAYIGKERALKDIEANLEAPEWFMRNAALVCLRNYFPEKAKPAAQKLLKDKALVVRSAAVEALGNSLDGKTRDLLWEELSAKYNYRKSQSLWIRSQILVQLSQAPLEREANLFLKALQEKDASMHSSAISALEKITQKNLGKSQQKLADKRSLWLQWARSHPQITESELR